MNCVFRILLTTLIRALEVKILAYLFNCYINIYLNIKQEARLTFAFLFFLISYNWKVGLDVVFFSFLIMKTRKKKIHWPSKVSPNYKQFLWYPISKENGSNLKQQKSGNLEPTHLTRETSDETKSRRKMRASWGTPGWHADTFCIFVYVFNVT